jgi:hypothetical protein
MLEMNQLPSPDSGDGSTISYLMRNERNFMEPSSFITNWQVRIGVHKIVVKEPHVC